MEVQFSLKTGYLGVKYYMIIKCVCLCACFVTVSLLRLAQNNRMKESASWEFAHVFRMHHIISMSRENVLSDINPIKLSNCLQRLNVNVIFS